MPLEFFSVSMTSQASVQSSVARMGATTGQKFGGRNRAKPEFQAGSARDLRDLRAKPESKAKSEKERGRGLGGVLVSTSPPSGKVLEFRTSNRSIWCIIVETKISK